MKINDAHTTVPKLQINKNYFSGEYENKPWPLLLKTRFQSYDLQEWHKRNKVRLYLTFQNVKRIFALGKTNKGVKSQKIDYQLIPLRNTEGLNNWVPEILLQSSTETFLG